MVDIDSKTIHYCWFGRSPKRKRIIQCIESWKKYFPDWRIIEWNEDNFDINCCQYVKDAYDMRMWAFVSDYCRFWALYKYGGIYFDTDVEVIRSFDDYLLENMSFTGFETENSIAPGLVMYAREPGVPIIKDTVEYYNEASFVDEQGNRIKKNVCGIFAERLIPYGYKPNGKMQKCGDIVIYPTDYFCPFDDRTGVLSITDNTYSIHWYDKSWMPMPKIIRNKLTRILHRMFGVDVRERVMKRFDR